MQRVKIQFCSDVNLDIKKGRFSNIIYPHGDVLILAGNIGNPFSNTYELFLEWCSQRFEKTILIPGNREYYGSDIFSTKEKLNSLCGKHGITLLDNKYIVIKKYNLVIIGSTFWNYIPKNLEFGERMNNIDYISIQDFDISLRNEMSMYCLEWLNQVLKYTSIHFPTFYTICVTHFSPLKYISNYNYNFVNIWITSSKHISKEFNSNILVNSRINDNYFTKKSILLDR